MHKTLVILSPGFPKDEDDSTCIPDRQTFVKVLKQTYPELHIIVIAFQYPFEAREYWWNGIKVIAIGGKDGAQLLRALTWLRVWMKLKKLSRENHVIGLLSFWLGECAFVADIFSKRNQLKHYCWLLGQDAKAGNRYINRVKPQGENLIALSDFITAEFEKNYGIKPKHLVPGGVDSSLFGPLPAYRDIDIVGAGSLLPLKQYAVFVDVIYQLKKQFPQIKAVICGNGPEMNRLQDKIQQLGLQDNLSLVGELPNAEVLALMQRAKVFLHTSDYEGFGIVCLEALYAGAKVVSFTRPMRVEIPNWHIASDQTHMEQLATSVLKEENSYYPVLPYTVSDNVKAVMQLFDQQEVAIS